MLTVEVYTLGRGTYGHLRLGDIATADPVEPPTVSSLVTPCASVDDSSSVSIAVTQDGQEGFPIH